jgi:hypothetical protein
MKLILDTCSWLKVRKLDWEKIITLKNLLYETDLWATHEIQTELQYYLSDYLDLRNFSIQKVSLHELSMFTEKELDSADLSLIEFGRQNPNCIVVCDDGAALQMLDMFNIQCFQLSEFIFFLVKNDILKKNQAIKSVKKLRDWKNIKENKKKHLLSKINAAT